jgi:hypothetical protein
MGKPEGQPGSFRLHAPGRDLAFRVRERIAVGASLKAEQALES